MAFKIIQSFFYRPDKLAGGWLSPTYNLVSWALSCHQLRQHYNTVELVTDAFGKQLLIDSLQLPYTHVRVEADVFQKYPEHLWAINKLYTYARQTEPFLHVDGDIFSWKPLIDDQMNPLLVVQNIEHTAYYFQYLSAIRKQFTYVPDALRPCLEMEPAIPPSINAGVLGGTDMAFIRAYADEAIRTIDQNLPFLSQQTELDNYNVVFEQLLFHRLAEQQQTPITTIQPDNFQLSECPIEHLGRTVNYLHPLGTFKRNFRLCEGLVAHLNAHYPETYERIRAYAATNFDPVSRSTAQLQRQRLFESLMARYAPDSAQARDLHTYRQAYATIRTALPVSPEAQRKTHQQTVELLQTDDDNLVNCRLRLAPNAVMVDTRWNWTITTPIDFCSPALLDTLAGRYSNKSVHKHQPTRAVIFWHEAARRVVEVAIQNDVQRVLLDGFRQPRQAREAIGEAHRRFPEYERNASEFTAFLYDSVRLLVSGGVLQPA